MTDAARPLAETPLDHLSWADFAPLVDQPFVVVAAGGVEVPLVLVRGRETPRSTRPGATRTSFTLLFRGVADAPALTGDGCYILRTPAGELPPLMISPVLPPDTWGDGPCYQAVFN